MKHFQVELFAWEKMLRRRRRRKRATRTQASSHAEDMTASMKGEGGGPEDYVSNLLWLTFSFSKEFSFSEEQQPRTSILNVARPFVHDKKNAENQSRPSAVSRPICKLFSIINNNNSWIFVEILKMVWQQIKRCLFTGQLSNHRLQLTTRLLTHRSGCQQDYFTHVCGGLTAKDLAACYGSIIIFMSGISIF